jgi:hypothetical protein
MDCLPFYREGGRDHSLPQNYCFITGIIRNADLAKDDKQLQHRSSLDTHLKYVFPKRFGYKQEIFSNGNPAMLCFTHDSSD